MSNLASRASGSRKISALAQSCATVRHRWANGQRLAAQETAEPILHEIRMRSQDVLERRKPVSGLEGRHVDPQVEKELCEVSSSGPVTPGARDSGKALIHEQDAARRAHRHSRVALCGQARS